ncbi:MAG: recombination protein O N-terminal domain-containing protein [Candidatus Krumholzibacteriota bacterium]
MAVMTRPAACTEALVLRAWPCGETSAVVSLLTRDHGYVKVIAKGARTGRSRLRPLIEPGRLVTAEFSLDPRRELQFLRGGEVDLDPMGEGATLERSAYLLGALELVDRCRPFGNTETTGRGEDSAPGSASGSGTAAVLFAVCESFVRMLSSRSCNRPALLFFAFEWDLLARHGMAPEVSACVGCGDDLDSARQHSLRFNPAEGGVVCGSCTARDPADGGRPLGLDAWAQLQEMARAEVALEVAGRKVEPLPRPLRRELGAHLHRFLGYHLPGYRLPAALDLLRAGKDSSG